MNYITIQEAREWVQNAFHNFDRSNIASMDEKLNGDNVKEYIDSFHPTTILYKTVQEYTNNYTNILPIEKAVELGIHSGPENGKGDRSKINRMFVLTVIYGSVRTPFTFPKCYDEIINLDETQINMIDEYKKSRIKEGLRMGSCVIGFIIHGKNTEDSKKRPIKNTIKHYHRKFPCIICGTKNTVCDHKNDLYNDKRVLNTLTQTVEDFQPLCNNCNLRKRTVSLKTIKEKKRQPPPPVILAMNGGIRFTSGDENFDPDDPNAMVGTYWYDPIAFGKECFETIGNLESSQ